MQSSFCKCRKCANSTVRQFRTSWLGIIRCTTPYSGPLASSTTQKVLRIGRRPFVVQSVVRPKIADTDRSITLKGNRGSRIEHDHVHRHGASSFHVDSERVTKRRRALQGKCRTYADVEPDTEEIVQLEQDIEELLRQLRED